MRKAITFLVASSALLCVAAMPQAEAEDEARILEVRATSNQAIVNRDLEILKTTWMPELHVTGSNGQVVTGGDKMASIFATIFADSEFVTYVRTPTEVRLSPGGRFAAESGQWSARWSKNDGEMEVRGTYLAQWHKRDDGWKIRSEVFISLACSGSTACRELP